MRYKLPMKPNYKRIIVNETYQQDYSYDLVEPTGKNFDTRFKPELSPKEMLGLGIFGGSYFKSTPKEFPVDWFKDVKLSASLRPEPSLNFFRVNASQSLQVWQKKGWINPIDPLGWFLWYCRYYLGRRIPDEDDRQIKRWLNIKRHIAQVKLNCPEKDYSCRQKQRQAILHWAYDSRKI